MSEQPVQVLWSRLLHLRSAPQTLAATTDGLVVAERHSRLVRLDRVDGTMLWQQRVDDCWGPPVPGGEALWLLEESGSPVKVRSQGAPCAAAAVAGGALIAYPDGVTVAVGRTGEVSTALRLPARQPASRCLVRRRPSWCASRSAGRVPSPRGRCSSRSRSGRSRRWTRPCGSSPSPTTPRG